MSVFQGRCITPLLSHTATPCQRALHAAWAAVCLRCCMARMQVVATAFAATLKRESLKRIQALNWLNEEIINMYMQVHLRSASIL